MLNGCATCSGLSSFGWSEDNTCELSKRLLSCQLWFAPDHRNPPVLSMYSPFCNLKQPCLLNYPLRTNGPRPKMSTLLSSPLMLPDLLSAERIFLILFLISSNLNTLHQLYLLIDSIISNHCPALNEIWVTIAITISEESREMDPKLLVNIYPLI